MPRLAKISAILPTEITSKLFAFNLSSIVSSGGSTEKSRLSAVLVNGYSPLKGLAITRPTACSPLRILLAILQYFSAIL